MVEEVEVTIADLAVEVKCGGVGDDNPVLQTSTKRKCPPDDEHGAQVKRCKVDECTKGLCVKHEAYSENNQGCGNHSNAAKATATADNYSNNFPRDSCQDIGMPMNHNFGQSNCVQSHRTNAMIIMETKKRLEKIAAAKERLRANRERNCEILSTLSSQTAELAKIEKEISKLERERARKELERREKEAALEDVKKEEKQIRNDLAHLNSLTEDSARKDVKIIWRSTPISPDDAKESTPTNALGQQPAGISGNEIDADKNQVDVEMENSTHINQGIKGETKSDSDSISDEHDSDSGDEQRPPAMAGARKPSNDNSSSEDGGSSHNHTTKANGTASPNGFEQLISASKNIDEKKKLPSLSWDEKYNILNGICDFFHEEFQKEKKKNDEFNYNPDIKMKLQDFIGRPADTCDCLPGRLRKLTYKDAIVMSNGEKREEEEVVMHKATQIKDLLKNLRRTGHKIPKKKEQLLQQLCFDVLSR